MKEFDKVMDSGEREDFSTGSRRDTRKGKGRYDLIPLYCLKRIAAHFEAGADKYGDHNWTKGQPISRYFDSAMRHMVNWGLGKDDEDHLSAAIWNLMCIMDHEKRIDNGTLDPAMDDRDQWPDYSDESESETVSAGPGEWVRISIDHPKIEYDYDAINDAIGGSPSLADEYIQRVINGYAIQEEGVVKDAMRQLITEVLADMGKLCQCGNKEETNE